MNHLEHLARREMHLPWLICLLALLCVAVYWDFLTFADLFLYKDIGSDTLNVFYPAYIHMADYLRTDGWPTWSFAQGMGQNIFPDSIKDPLSLLLILLGSEHVADGLAFVQVARVVLAGVLFYLYARLLPVEPLAAILGALFYAFSSFMILGGTWYVFAAQGVYFAFLLYGFERYLKFGQWIWLVLGIALVAAVTPFYLYSLAVFFLLYGLFRFYLENGEFNRRLPGFLARLAGFGVLGVGISAVFFFAKLLQMINSPRVLGDASFFGELSGWGLLGFESYEHNLTALMRLFSSDLLGTGSEFRGWRNYLEAPMFYCGLLPLLLAPQVFAKLDQKRRIIYAVFGLLLLLPTVLPFFRYLLSAFTGDYYRLYSLYVAFVFLYFALQGLNEVLRSGVVRHGWLIASLAVLATLLFSPHLLGVGAKADSVDGPLTWTVFGLLLIYAILVAALGSSNYRTWAKAGLLLVVCAELAGFAWITVNDRQVVTAKQHASKTGYNDYTLDAVSLLKQRDTGFYRIEKTYSSGPAVHTSLNDAKVQGYFGTRSYHSFNQLNYIRFLASLGVIDGRKESATRWATGIINYRALVSVSGIKYVLIKRDARVRKFLQSGYKLVDKVGDVTILMNPQFLPLGYTYDRYMTEKSFESLSLSERRTVLLKAAVVEEDSTPSLSEGMERLGREDIAPKYNMASYLDDVNQRRHSPFEINDFSQSRISGEIILDRPQMLFFSLPFDPGWRATVDGEPVKIQRVNVGFSGLLLEAGKHDVELRFRLPWFNPSLLVSVLSLGCLFWLLWKDRSKAVSAADSSG